MNPFRSPLARERTPILAQAPVPTGTGSVSIRLYDPIDSWGDIWGVSAKEFTETLDALPEDTTEIRLLINSPGGEVWDGLAILNALRSHPARVVAVVEGIAASAASFIAAGADELVMMRNSELFIHNAWGIVMGDADDLVNEAANLSRLDRNLADIYATKSGESPDFWLTEMKKDRFLTAEEAVAAGLADRIEGVGDAAAARARFDLTVFAHHGRAAALAPQERSSSPEPSGPNPKEKATMADDNLTAGLRTRLGVTETDLTDEQLLAALDEALAETAADSETTTIPDGTVLIDGAVLASLQSDAAEGRAARAEQNTNRREALVAQALADGRIAPASRDQWLAALTANEAATAPLLGQLAVNKIPVTELGVSDDSSNEVDRAYASAWGTTPKGA